MDTLANALTIVHTAYMRHKPYACVLFSKHTWDVLRVLYVEGYIKGCAATRTHIFVTLKYTEKGPALRAIRRLSSPGKRTYASKGACTPLLKGLGTILVSTPKGVVCDRDARKLRVGGELLAHVF